MESIKKHSRVSAVALCLVGIAILGSSQFIRDKAATSPLIENEYGMSRAEQPFDLKGHKDKHIFLSKMREEFHLWAKEHGREYTEEEKDKRFHIWVQNHLRCV
jgi:hypothetical protein